MHSKGPPFIVRGFSSGFGAKIDLGISMQLDSSIEDIFGVNPYGILVNEMRDFVIFLLDVEGALFPGIRERN